MHVYLLARCSLQVNHIVIPQEAEEISNWNVGVQVRSAMSFSSCLPFKRTCGSVHFSWAKFDNKPSRHEENLCFLWLNRFSQLQALCAYLVGGVTSNAPNHAINVFLLSPLRKALFCPFAITFSYKSVGILVFSHLPLDMPRSNSAHLVITNIYYFPWTPGQFLPLSLADHFFQ